MIESHKTSSIQEARYQCHQRPMERQARDLGSYLVIKRVGTLHWAFENFDGKQLTKVCEVKKVKPYFKTGIT